MATAEEKSDEPIRKVGQYIIGETLGKGGYSWVKLGVDEKTKNCVALKFMTRAGNFDDKQAQQVRTEIKSLIRVKHPNVMELYAYNLNCMYPEKSGAKLSTILLVLEYCPGGELFDILYYSKQLDAITARTYFLQMIKGIQACHDVGIVHRDIKPQNLLMDSSFQLKLTDFGLSFLGKKGMNAEKIVMNTKHVGTRGYQAPEQLKREPYKKACDIFSAGVVLFILLTGYPPFEQAMRSDKWYNPLVRKDTEKFWKQHKGCGVDEDCEDLIAKMLAYKPHHRPNINEVLEHPWISGDKATVHDPKELYRVLKEKHSMTRRRRRLDKKKMADMENSIKKRSKKRCKDTAVDLSKLSPCPVFLLQDYVHTWMSFIAKEEHLNEAYWLARNVFDMAFQNQTYTNPSQTDPWTLTTAIKMSSNDIIYEYLVQIRIVKIKDLGKYSFAFNRLQGDPWSYQKIWAKIEPLVLAMRSADGKDLVFKDDCDDIDEDVECFKAIEADERKTMDDEIGVSV